MARKAKIVEVVETEVEVTPSFSEKLSSGYFDARDLTYPKMPSKPEILRKPIAPSDLTAEILEKVQAARVAYDAEKQVYDQKYAENKAIAAKRLEEYRAGLPAEYGIAHLPEAIEERIYGKAYEDGHAYGYGEIANYYCDLAEFTLDIIRLSKTA